MRVLFHSFTRWLIYHEHVFRCDVARIQPLTDITPTDEVTILEIRCLGSQILYKALLWLNGMNKTVRAEIETAFGEIPNFSDDNEPWWNSSDGPAWLWWLIAILPLRSEIKVYYLLFLLL